MQYKQNFLIFPAKNRNLAYVTMLGNLCVANLSWYHSTYLNFISKFPLKYKLCCKTFAKIFVEGVKYWCAWDRDLAPEGDTLEDTQHNLDEMTEFVLDLQQKTSIKPLWLAANFHYTPR